METLQEKYIKSIRPELKKELLLKSDMQIPRFEKVVVSAGVGDFKDSDEMIKKAAHIIASVTGLKPKINKSKKAVSAFKLRIGQTIGLTVTLRGEKMYSFVDRLVNVAMPRVRDFRGLKKEAFDKNGNYSVGIRDSAIFPEIKMEEAIPSFGFQVNIKTTAGDDKEAHLLLSKLGFPFKKER